MATQNPPVKGKLDVFGVIHDFAASGSWDPITTASEIHAHIRKNNLEPTFDEEAIRNKFQEDPFYKEDPNRLNQDIEIARGYFKDIFDPAFRPLRNQDLERSRTSQNQQINRQLNFGVPVLNPFERSVEEGTYEFAGRPVLNAQQLAAGRPGKMGPEAEYIDRFGQRQKLTGRDISSGRLYVDVEAETDQYGRVRNLPILRETKEGEERFGKDMVSRLGLRQEDRTWVGGALTGASNGLLDFFAIPIGGVTAMANESLSDRLVGLQKLFTQAQTPAFIQNWKTYRDNGDLSARSDVNRVDYDKIVQANEEDIDSVVAELKKDYQAISSAAGAGDPTAKAMVDFVDLYDNTKGHSWLQKWANEIYNIQQGSRFSESRRVQEEGALGSMEGFLSSVGYSMAQMMPAARIGAGLGAITRAAGARAISGKIGQASSVALNAKWANAVNKVTQAGFYIPMTGVATNQVYNTAREAGLDHDNASLLAAASSPGILLTEKIISAPWAVRSYMAGGGVRQAEEMLAKSLGKEIKQAIKLGELNTAQKMSQWLTTKGPMAAVNGWVKTLSKGSQIAWKNRAMNAAEGFIREGTQESLEESWYAAMEQVIAPEVFGTGGQGYVDFYERLKESFVIGGAAGAGYGAINARRPSPDQTSIHKSVIDGKGEEILSVAKNMQQEGRITDDEYNVVQQTVNVATAQVANQLAADPVYAGYIRGDEDLAREYAETSVGLKNAQDAVAQAEQVVKDAGTDPALLQTAQSALVSRQEELANAQAKYNRIVDGTRATEMISDVALRKSNLPDFQKTGRSFQRPYEAVKVLENLYNQFTQSTQQMDAEMTGKRASAINKLAVSLDQLSNSNLKNTKEAFNVLDEVLLEMRQSGVLTKEDISNITSKAAGVRSKLLAELFDLDFTSEGQEKQTLGQAVAASPEFEQLSEEDIVQDLINQRSESGTLSQKEEEIAAGLGVLNQLRSKQEALGATTDKLPTEASFNAPTESMQSRFMTAFGEGANWTQANRLLEELNQVQELTEEDAKNLFAIIQQLNFNQLMPNLSKGILQAAEFMKDFKSPGFQQFNQIAQQIHAPFAGMTQQEIDNASNTIDALQKRVSELARQSDLRKFAIQNEHKRVLDIDLYLSEFYFKSFPDAKNEKAFELFNQIDGIRNQEGVNSYDLERLVIALKQEIYNDIKKHPARFSDFIKASYTAYLHGGSLDASYGYGNTDFAPAAPTVETFQFLFNEKEKQFSGYQKLGGKDVFIGVSMTIGNWISTIAANPADFYSNYNTAFAAKEQGSVTPHSLQRRAIEEIVALSKLSSDQVNALFFTAKPNSLPKNNIPRAVSLAGRAGAGKTTILRMLVDVLDAQSQSQNRIGVIAPGSENVQKIQEALTSDGRSVVPFSNIATDPKNNFSEIDILVVDEAHFITESEIPSWRVIMEQNPNIKNVYFIGDVNQTSASVNEVPVAFPVARFGPMSTPLNVSIRNNNMELVHFQDIIAESLSDMEVLGVSQYPSFVNTKYMDNGIGVRLQASVEAVVNMFAEEIQTKGQTGRALIVINEEQRQQVISQLRNKIESSGIKADLIKHIEENVRTMSSGPNSAMGREYPYAYVAIDENELRQAKIPNPEKALPRYLYTAITRASGGLVTVYPKPTASVLVNEIVSKAPDLKMLSDIQENEKNLALSIANDLSAFTTKPTETPSPAPTAATQGAEPTTPTAEGPVKSSVGPEWVKNAVLNNTWHVLTQKGIKSKEVKALQIPNPESPFKILSITPDGKNVEVKRADGRVFTLPLSVVKQKPVDGQQLGLFTDAEPDEDSLQEADTDSQKTQISPKEDAPKTDERQALGVEAASVFRINQGGPIANNTYDVQNNIYARLHHLLLRKIAQHPHLYTFQVRIQKDLENWRYVNNPAFAPLGKLATRGGALYVGHINQVEPIVQVIRELGENAPENLKTLISKGTPTWNDLYAAGITNVFNIPVTLNNLNSNNTVISAEQKQFYEQLRDNQNYDSVSGAPINPELQQIRLSYINTPIAVDNTISEEIRDNYSLPYSKLVELASQYGWELSTTVFKPADDTRSYSNAVLVVYPLGQQNPQNAQTIFIRGAKTDVEYLESINQAWVPFGEFDKFLQANNSRLKKQLGQTPLGKLLKEEFYTVKGVQKTRISPIDKSAKGVNAIIQIIKSTPNSFQKNLDIADTKSFEVTPESLADAMTSVLPTGKFDNPDNRINVFLSIPNTQQETPKGKESASNQNIPDFDYSAVPAQLITRELFSEAKTAAVEYLRRVLGDRFVDKKLEFKPAFTDLAQDRLVFGRVGNGLMTLYEYENGIRQNVARHEALHYVMRYLLDDASNAALIAEAKLELAAKRPGSSVNDFTDTDAREHIANEYEVRKPETTSLIGRFIAWLKNVLRRWGLYQMNLQEIYNAIDSGVYRNSKLPYEGSNSQSAFNELAEPDYSEVNTSDINPDAENNEENQETKNLIETLLNPNAIRLQRLYWSSNILSDIGLSNIDPSRPTDVVSLQESILNRYGNLLKQIKESPSEGTFIDGQTKNLDEITKADWDYLDSRSRNLFIRHQLGKPEVYTRFIKSLFPRYTLQLGTIQKFEELNESSEQIDIGNFIEENGRINGNAHNSNDLYSIQSKASDLVKLSLFNLNHVTAVRDQKGSILYLQENNTRGISSNYWAILTKAAQQIPTIIPDNTNIYNLFGENILQIGQQGGQIGDAAMALYAKFFNPGIPFYKLNETPGVNSGRDSFYSAVAIKSQDEQYVNEFEDSIEMQELLLKQMVSLIRSFSAHNMSYDKGTQRGSEVVTILSDPIERVRISVIQQLNALYTPNGESFEPNPVYRQFVSIKEDDSDVNANTILKIRQNGVFLSTGSTLLTFLDSNGKVKVELGKDLKNKGRTEVFTQELSKFFEAIGVHNISPSALLQVLQDKNKRESLKNLIYYWSNSIHNTWNNLEGNPVTWSSENTAKYRGRKEVNRLKISEDNSLLPPVAYGTEVNLLSELIASSGSWANPSVRNFKGKIEQMISTGTLLRRALRPKTNTRTTGQSLFEHVQSLASNPAFGMFHMGEILGRNSGVYDSIQDVFEHEGYRDSKKELDYGLIDSYDHEIEALNDYARSIIRGQQTNDYSVRLNVFGDRTKMRRLIVRLSDYVTSDGYNLEAIAPMLKDIAHYYMEQEQASIGRWTAAGLDYRQASMYPYETIKNKGLIENMDYILDSNGMVNPGRALISDHPIYDKTGIQEIVNGNFSRLQRRATEYANEMPGTNDAIKESYWFLNHVYDHFVRVASAGSPYLHSTFENSVKRGSSIESPSIVGVFPADERYVLSLVINPKDTEFQGAPKRFDGQKWVMPWMQLSNEAAYGGRNGVYKRGVNKMIYASPLVIDKSAEVTITAEMYRNNPFYRTLVLQTLRRSGYSQAAVEFESRMSQNAMLLPKEYNKRYWQEISMIYDSMINSGGLANVYGFVTSKDNIKQGYSGDTMVVDRNFYGFQTDLSRNISANSVVSQASQITAFMRANPTNAGFVQELDQNEMAFHIEMADKLNKEIASLPGETIHEKTKNYVLSLINTSAGQQSELGQLVIAAARENASPNDPLFGNKVLAAVAGFLNNQINPRLQGSQYSAISSYGFTNKLTKTELRSPGVVDGVYQMGETVMPFSRLEVFGNTVTPDMNIDEMRLAIGQNLGSAALLAFEDMLTVYVMRTPASGLASGHWFKIVDFVQDAGNVIALPDGFNDLSGGDYDGDQVSVFFRPYTVAQTQAGPVIVRDNNLQNRYQNAWMDALNNIYKNPDANNISDISSSVGTAKIEEIANSISGSSLPMTALRQLQFNVTNNEQLSQLVYQKMGVQFVDENNNPCV